jgi:hypothetical protein
MKWRKKLIQDPIIHFVKLEETSEVLIEQKVAGVNAVEEVSGEDELLRQGGLELLQDKEKPQILCFPISSVGLNCYIEYKRVLMCTRCFRS